MNTLNLQVPDSLHKQLHELAAREGVTVDQLASSALSEKMAALLPQEYLEERAARGQRAKFEGVLARVQDVEAEENDRL